MAQILTITGKTFEIKEQLKAEGYRWNLEAKGWSKAFADTDKDYVKLLAESLEADGTLTATITHQEEEKKYRVKEDWIFNLESMHDKLWCLTYDVQEGKLKYPFTVAGRTMNSEDDIYQLQEEAEELEYKAKSGKVTGSEYGRIREIVAWRVEVRYVTCLAAGMSEKEAGRCFEDM